MNGEAGGAEIPLTGGRITPGVVRIGNTVRRPLGEHSPFVHELLRHLEERGFDNAPRLLGIDDQKREILSFLPGETAVTFMARDWLQPQITAAGRLLRELHDVTADTPLADGEETVCHNDFSPLNVVFVSGSPVAVFDFDQARPGERSRDLAYAAWIWLLGAAVEDRLDQQLTLLREFLDAYGVRESGRQNFGARIAARVDEERDFHERAGRGASLGWLRNEIAWLRAHADVISSALISRYYA